MFEFVFSICTFVGPSHSISSIWDNQIEFFYPKLEVLGGLSFQWRFSGIPKGSNLWLRGWMWLPSQPRRYSGKCGKLNLILFFRKFVYNKPFKFCLNSSILEVEWICKLEFTARPERGNFILFFISIPRHDICFYLLRIYTSMPYQSRIHCEHEWYWACIKKDIHISGNWLIKFRCCLIIRNSI